MALQEVTDKRHEYAQRLRELADDLEKTNRQPIAMFASIHWVGDSSVAGLEKIDDGANYFAISGFFQHMSLRVLDGGTHSIPLDDNAT